MVGWRGRLPSAKTVWIILSGDCRGVTAVEYALLTALVALAAVSAIFTFSSNATTAFTNLANHM